MVKKTLKSDEQMKTVISEELLKSILERLEAIEDIIKKPITSQVESLHESIERPIEREIVPVMMPVPEDWRKEIDNILNKDFEIELEPHKDAPVTTFTVIVPDKYSLMTPSQREIIKRDIRPKVITNAGGVNEVKEWAETIYKNLTPEIQAMIVSDRMKA